VIRTSLLRINICAFFFITKNKKKKKKKKQKRNKLTSDKTCELSLVLVSQFFKHFLCLQSQFSCWCNNQSDLFFFLKKKISNFVQNNSILTIRIHYTNASSLFFSFLTLALLCLRVNIQTRAHQTREFCRVPFSRE
jgi:hypothetical protein